MAKIIALNISGKKSIEKTNIDCADFIENYGMKDDAHAGNWHRQVSFLAKESIEKMQQLGIEGLTPGKFAENITTEGLELFSLKIGTLLKAGDVIFEVTQIGKKCHGKCEIFYKIGHCIMPKEGIFAKVIKGGTIKKNQSIKIV